MPTPDTDTDTQNPSPPAWTAQLPDDLKGNETLTRYATIGDLGKSYLELARKTEGAVKIPAPDATEDERATYYKAIGRPDKPDGYELKPPQLPDGLNYDQKLEAGFRGTAHKLGLSPTQAKGLYDWYNQTFIDAHKTINDLSQANRQNTEEALKVEWGDQYPANLELARRACYLFGGDEAKAFLEQSGLGDNPVLIRMFAKIGTKLMDDTLVQGTPGGSPKAQGPGMIAYPSMDRQQ